MAFWKRVSSWTYQVFEPNVDATDVLQFEPLIELWQSKFKGHLIPAWSDFSFDDFYGWHGWLRVGDFIPGQTDDYEYRLWGVHAVNFYGVDLTGKRMSELDFGFDDDDRTLLDLLATQKMITLATGPVFWQERDHLEVSVVKMPLADDGVNVDKFLGAFRHRNINPEIRVNRDFSGTDQGLTF